MACVNRLARMVDLQFIARNPYVLGQVVGLHKLHKPGIMTDQLGVAGLAERVGP